jgi:hypothetical protein
MLNQPESLVFRPLVDRFLPNERRLAKGKSTGPENPQIALLETHQDWIGLSL